VVFDESRSMTHDEWVACDEPLRMLQFVRAIPALEYTTAFFRKPDLVGVAFARGVWEELPNSLQLLIEQIEYAADNPNAPEVNAGELEVAEALSAIYNTLLHCWSDGEELNLLPESHAERVTQAKKIRDIFGNPFRLVSFSPSWQTSTAIALANSMYESRDFTAMPVLADALEEAVCDSADVLAHCRGPGPHVRGCWVVDLVLGKS
jgi:hypothetical protein